MKELTLPKPLPNETKNDFYIRATKILKDQNIKEEYLNGFLFGLWYGKDSFITTLITKQNNEIVNKTI